MIGSFLIGIFLISFSDLQDGHNEKMWVNKKKQIKVIGKLKIPVSKLVLCNINNR